MHQSRPMPPLPHAGEPALIRQLLELFDQPHACSRCSSTGRVWIAMADLGSCGVPCACSDTASRRGDAAEWIAWGLAGMVSISVYVIAMAAT